MTPYYHCKISQFPINEEDQHQSHIPFFSLGSSSTCTSPSGPFLLDHDQHGHGAHDGTHPHHQAQLHEKIKGSPWSNYVKNQSSSYQYVRGEDHRQDQPAKWMSSKMRIMRKMMSSYQTTNTKPRKRNNQIQDQKKVNLETIIRVCSDCNTTKTPLWRSGPRGLKSLCNACGIRQRKARRAIAAAAASVSSRIVLKVGEEEEVSDVVDRRMPFKKRCRFSAAAAAATVSSAETVQRKLCFEDIVISLNKNTAFHRVFPQDEKDAAILLMALSCGLLCSS